MMKTKLIILVCMLIMPSASLLASTSLVIDESRPVRDFNGLYVTGSFDVDVRLDRSESLRIVGSADVIRSIETVVENGILYVRTKPGITLSSDKFKGLKIYVSAIRLEDVGLSGSGSVRVADVLALNKLNLSLSGSGRVETTARVDETNINLSGSGVVSIKGESKKINVRISGSGRIDGVALKSEMVNVKISGSGSATLHAESTLAAAISGSGTLRYGGNPEVSLKKSGSGALIKI